jgi:hypothetical protein
VHCKVIFWPIFLRVNERTRKQTYLPILELRVAAAEYVDGLWQEDRNAIPFSTTIVRSNNRNYETSYCTSQFVNIIS